MTTETITRRLRSPASVFYEYDADGGALLRESAAEIDRLHAELDKYGTHRDPCKGGVKFMIGGKWRRTECTCGLDAAQERR